MVELNSAEPIEQLSELFGNYKAEYLREKIFSLFTKPSYFPELETARPCALIGGRGTGKTTVLRSLSYEGQFALGGEDRALIPSWKYYGFYLRVDTNRVTAFEGPELSEKNWNKIFGHYINILLCANVLKFLNWYESACNKSDILSPNECGLISLSLGLEPASNLRDLRDNLTECRVKFESFLNNISEDNMPVLSLQGAPVDQLMAALSETEEFRSKYFFFLIDEYENYLDNQQAIINTLIKHSGSSYTFKIGARVLGWRNRHTLNPNERLTSPADYALIDISEKLSDKMFESFAADIVNQRIRELDTSNGVAYPHIQELLETLTIDEEADVLGVRGALADKIAKSRYDARDIEQLESMPPLEAYFATSLAGRKRTMSVVLDERKRDARKWTMRYDNYKYATLFTINAGKTGYRKAYAGWKTFVLLSGGNIRYLIELVDQTLVAHKHASGVFGEKVKWETQTAAAAAVGRKNVSELEGLSVHGAHLTKLVLGLGKIFQVMAADREAHAPEVNQFTLPDTGETDENVRQLLSASVMHLALVRYGGSKLARSEVADWDYALHPIFSPFFMFSHRKKRKMKLRAEQLIGLVRNPNNTIIEILESKNRDIDSVPSQPGLFGDYYAS